MLCSVSGFLLALNLRVAPHQLVLKLDFDASNILN